MPISTAATTPASKRSTASDPWRHLERNFEARMKRDQPIRREREDDARPPTPRCDRTRDMFEGSDA